MSPARQRSWLVLGGLAAVAVLAVGVYWQSAGSGSPSLVDYRDTETTILGKQIYGEHCANCHGVNLEGQPNWHERRSDGRLPAPPHDESGHTWHHSDQQLFELTKFGTAAFVGGDYESDMLGYDEILPDEEILAALAYIKSTWPREIRERHDEINHRARNTETSDR